MGLSGRHGSGRCRCRSGERGRCAGSRRLGPDKLRRDPATLSLVRAVDAAQGLVATICHGPWILISAGILRGRTLTWTVGIRDDVVNAGATWVNEPSVIDGNLVSARLPKDLPAFARAILTVLDGDGRR